MNLQLDIDATFNLIRLDRKLTKKQKGEIQSNSEFGLTFEDKIPPYFDANGVAHYGVNKEKVTYIYHDRHEDVPGLVSAINEYFSS